MVKRQIFSIMKQNKKYEINFSNRDLKMNCDK